MLAFCTGPLSCQGWAAGRSSASATGWAQCIMIMHLACGSCILESGSLIIYGTKVYSRAPETLQAGCQVYCV